MLLATTALAADLPVVTKVPPATAQSWAGFYLGVHGGYGWGKNDYFLVPFPNATQGGTVGSMSSRGAVYGVQAGYNWQYGRVVTGVEIDFTAADIAGSTTTAGVVPNNFTYVRTQTERAKNLGTARARLGWLPADNVLIYGTAGAAWERFDASFSERDVSAVFAFQNGTNAGTVPSDRFGWVAGAGVETKLPGSNWIGRIEYLHYDFGAVQQISSVATTFPGNFPFSERAGHQTYDTVRAALSYKFGAPVAASVVPYAKAPTIAVATSWAGFYLGVHGGYGWGENKFTDPWRFTPLASLVGPALKGGVYGGHAGYNWQFERAVASLELDFSGTGIGGNSPISIAGAESASTSEKVAYLGSIRARLGWSLLDSVLLYGTAGLGWERLDRNLLIVSPAAAGTQTFASVSSSNRFGWVAGAGAEARLPGSNWIGRLEYLHYDFGTTEPSGLINTDIFVPQTAGNHHLDILRAGLSYKFGDPGAAQALPYAKAPAPLASMTWAGFYLGGHGGYAWKDNDFSQVLNFNNVAQANGIKSRGWLAGGHAGYNWQYGRVVTGLEGDFSFSGLSGNSATVAGPDEFPGFSDTAVLGDRVKYLVTSRARLGWLPAETVLLYATGGLAWERLERTLTRGATGGGLFRTDWQRTPSDHFGGVIGAGAEWTPWGPNWIARLEYLHCDFGKVQDTITFTSTVPGNLAYSEHRGRQTIEALRAGISYKFGVDQPIVARY